MSLSEEVINRIERALSQDLLHEEEVGTQVESDRDFIEKTYMMLRTKSHMDFRSAEREARKAWLRTL